MIRLKRSKIFTEIQKYPDTNMENFIKFIFQWISVVYFRNKIKEKNTTDNKNTEIVEMSTY